jgi:sulfate adenylyltransferase
MPIEPHGGTLINRQLEGEQKEKLEKRAGSLERKRLNTRELSDLEMIATGALSPLEGFMTSADYRPVVDRMRMGSGLPWTIPITLSAERKDAEGLKEGSDVALVNDSDEVLAVLHLEEKFSFDKEHEAQQVLRTIDDNHPGVQYLKTIGDIYLGGKNKPPAAAGTRGVPCLSPRSAGDTGDFHAEGLEEDSCLPDPQSYPPRP